MTFAAWSTRRSVLAAAVAAAAGSALLLPIASRSREIELRARSLNASLAAEGTRHGRAAPTSTRRFEGTPREVFAWLREIEAAPPPAFTVELSIATSGAEEPTLVAALHEGNWEMDR